MQYSTKFSFIFVIVSAIAGGVNATPSPVADATKDAVDNDASYIVSYEQMAHWISTTDAQLTFVGEPINPLSPRASQSTIVTYCNTRSFDVCGGACTVYNGGATCLAAPGTQCLSATNNVAFCAPSGCSSPCNQLSTCGTPLGNGFCWTPGTNSIIVSSA